MSKFRRTERGHDPLVLVSLLQKSIRRARPDLAAYAACDLLRSGYADWCWRRLTVVAAEDVAAYATAEILALRAACDAERKARRGQPPTRVFVAKAVVILCSAAKSRDADHLTNLIVDRLEDSDPRLLGALLDAEADVDTLPAWTFDCHTSEGRRAGKTRRDFFASEHVALTPRLPGLFDDLIDDLRDE